jgi:hypothetical protein
MLTRCNNPKARFYHRYGGRGIGACERWSIFENFIADMGCRPSAKHSLERDRLDEDYSPSNCRWATMREQQRNRSTNHRLTAFGRTLTMVEWAEDAGIKWCTLNARITRYGWSVERAITTPVQATRWPSPKAPRHRYKWLLRSRAECDRRSATPSASPAAKQMSD